jgi:uncharacterized oligopeptide transporter (OPT) family protein
VWRVAVALAMLAACVGVCAGMLGMGGGEIVVALLLAGLLALASIRTLGETDVNPVSGLGKLTQAVFAAVSPDNVVVNLLAGAVSEAIAAQAADLMMDLKTGRLLGVSPLKQAGAQAVGTVVGILVSLAVYTLLASTTGVPSQRLPAPTATVWLAMARLAEQGLGILPASLMRVCAGVIALTVVVCVAKALPAPRSPTPAATTWQRRALHRVAAAAQWIPSPSAVAVGMYVTPNWALVRLAGAVGFAAWGRLHPRSHAASWRLLAAGLVVGEGLMGIATAGLGAAGVRPLTCSGCPVVDGVNRCGGC